MAQRKRKGRRKAQRRRTRVAKSPRAIELALAGIAHDIRTPLTGIVALAELLASSDLDKREKEWASALKSGADHLAALANLIVDAVRSETKGIALRREPFSPRALSEAVGQGLLARAGNKDVHVELAIADDLPAMVAGDALRLRAALENLTDNAVKFTQSGIIRFAVACESASRGRARLSFSVTDSGIGMSAGELKLLFRPFAQASAEIARRYGGAGLGLSFVRRIARAMSGDLTVTAEKGCGTTFRLTVVVECVDARPAAVESGVMAPVRPLKLLCAEDNPYGRVVMNTILTELGHRADFAQTGKAAVEAAARGGYDVVLMDIALGDLGGLEATRRIRALPGKAGEVPIIGISGHGDSESAARAAGMNSYLAKPVSPRKLADALAVVAN